MINDIEIQDKAKDIISRLSQFCGTEQYYFSQMNKNIKYTDGIKAMCELCECYWLLDLILLNQNKVIGYEDFLIWRIEVNNKSNGIIYALKDNYGVPNKPNKNNIIWKYRVPYTDYPLSIYEFYQCNGVLLLKSEY